MLTGMFFLALARRMLSRGLGLEGEAEAAAEPFLFFLGEGEGVDDAGDKCNKYVSNPESG